MGGVGLQITMQFGTSVEVHHISKCQASMLKNCKLVREIENFFPISKIIIDILSFFYIMTVGRGHLLLPPFRVAAPFTLSDNDAHVPYSSAVRPGCA